MGWQELQVLQQRGLVRSNPGDYSEAEIVRTTDVNHTCIHSCGQIIRTTPFGEEIIRTTLFGEEIIRTTPFGLEIIQTTPFGELIIRE